tara:strand:+ start:2320 stop:5445 length:3126 start_codon:yes stop_codon:yes gene_type:complete
MSWEDILKVKQLSATTKVEDLKRRIDEYNKAIQEYRDLARKNDFDNILPKVSDVSKLQIKSLKEKIKNNKEKIKTFKEELNALKTKRKSQPKAEDWKEKVNQRELDKQINHTKNLVQGQEKGLKYNTKQLEKFKKDTQSATPKEKQEKETKIKNTKEKIKNLKTKLENQYNIIIPPATINDNGDYVESKIETKDSKISKPSEELWQNKLQEHIDSTKPVLHENYKGGLPKEQFDALDSTTQQTLTRVADRSAKKIESKKKINPRSDIGPYKPENVAGGFNFRTNERDIINPSPEYLAAKTQKEKDKIVEDYIKINREKSLLTLNPKAVKDWEDQSGIRQVINQKNIDVKNQPSEKLKEKIKVSKKVLKDSKNKLITLKKIFNKLSSSEKKLSGKKIEEQIEDLESKIKNLEDNVNELTITDYKRKQIKDKERETDTEEKLNWEKDNKKIIDKMNKSRVNLDVESLLKQQRVVGNNKFTTDDLESVNKFLIMLKDVPVSNGEEKEFFGVTKKITSSEPVRTRGKGLKAGAYRNNDTISINKGKQKFLDILTQPLFSKEDKSLTLTDKLNLPSVKQLTSKITYIITTLKKINTQQQSHWSNFLNGGKLEAKFNTSSSVVQSSIQLLKFLIKETRTKESVNFDDDLIEDTLFKYKSGGAQAAETQLRELEKDGFFSPKVVKRFNDYLFFGNEKGMNRTSSNPFIEYTNQVGDSYVTKFDDDEGWIKENDAGANLGSAIKMYGSSKNNQEKSTDIYKEILQRMNISIKGNDTLSNSRGQEGTGKESAVYSQIVEFLKSDEQYRKKGYTNKVSEILGAGIDKPIPIERAKKLFSQDESNISMLQTQFLIISKDVLDTYETLEKLEKIDFTIPMNPFDAPDSDDPKFDLEKFNNAVSNITAHIKDQSPFTGSSSSVHSISKITILEFIYAILKEIGSERTLERNPQFNELKKKDFTSFLAFDPKEKTILEETNQGEELIEETEELIDELNDNKFNKNKIFNNLIKAKELIEKEREETIKEPVQTKSQRIAKALRRINRKKTMLEGLL